MICQRKWDFFCTTFVFFITFAGCRTYPRLAAYAVFLCKRAKDHWVCETGSFCRIRSAPLSANACLSSPSNRKKKKKKKRRPHWIPNIFAGKELYRSHTILPSATMNWQRHRNWGWLWEHHRERWPRRKIPSSHLEKKGGEEEKSMNGLNVR